MWRVGLKAALQRRVVSDRRLSLDFSKVQKEGRVASAALMDRSIVWPGDALKMMRTRRNG